VPPARSLGVGGISGGTRQRRWRAAAILAAPAAVAIGCSSSSNNAAVGSGDAAVTDAAENGRDGPIGAIKELNADAEVTNTVTCGGTMCNPPMGGMIPLTACCLPNGECGASFGTLLGGGGGDGGGTCISTAPGTMDPSCPAQSAMGMMLPACCSAEGVCGVDLSAAGLGCNSLSVFGALAGGGAGVPQPCGDAAVASAPPDAAAPSDAAAPPNAAGE
jgi:hypothetical protein